MSTLSETARAECLFLARKTLHEYVRRQRHNTGYSPGSEELNERRGAFVTLKSHGSLRGCIGFVEPVKALWEVIVESTVSAASRDPRFDPVRAEELPDIHLEISVLSPLEDVQDVMNIHVGSHGLVVSKGLNRGLLLPQVPVEWGWDRTQFLEHTCLKAGLPGNAWREDVRIQSFTADVFSENIESEP